jgi:hypothetical protein
MSHFNRAHHIVIRTIPETFFSLAQVAPASPVYSFSLLDKLRRRLLYRPYCNCPMRTDIVSSSYSSHHAMSTITPAYCRSQWLSRSTRGLIRSDLNAGMRLPYYDNSSRYWAIAQWLCYDSLWPFHSLLMRRSLHQGYGGKLEC